MSPEDLRYLERCLELAELGARTAAPNPMVGCVLVRDGAVIGEGWHERPGLPHAEVDRPGGGGRRVGCHRLRQPRAVRAPRPHAALLRGPDRCRRRSRGDRGGRPGSPHQRTRHRAVARRRASRWSWPPATSSCRARRQNAGFRTLVRLGRPHVTYKAAVSIDGRVAAPGGEPRWISSPQSRALVHEWRARSGAVAVGLGTALADDPMLTARDCAAAGGAPAAAGRVRPRGPATGRLGAGAERRRRPGGRGVPSGRARDRRTHGGRGRGDRGKRLRPGAGRAGPPTAWRRCCWREAPPSPRRCGGDGLVDRLALFVAPLRAGCRAECAGGLARHAAGRGGARAEQLARSARIRCWWPTCTRSEEGRRCSPGS